MTALPNIIKCQKLNEHARMPEYQTEGSACMDLHASSSGQVPQGKTAMISTGLSVEIPEGYELQIRARSSLAKRGILLSNGIGTIDSDYRGELKVLLTNCSDDTFYIGLHDRIAQCCLQKTIKSVFVESDLTSTIRGIGGFGSTGRGE